MNHCVDDDLQHLGNEPGRQAGQEKLIGQHLFEPVHSTFPPDGYSVFETDQKTQIVVS